MNCLIPGLFLDLTMRLSTDNIIILRWLVQLLMQFIAGVFSDRVHHIQKSYMGFVPKPRNYFCFPQLDHATGVCTTEYRQNLHVPYLLSNVYNMVP
jgi:hypothetical protein